MHVLVVCELHLFSSTNLQATHTCLACHGSRAVEQQTQLGILMMCCNAMTTKSVLVVNIALLIAGIAQLYDERQAIAVEDYLQSSEYCS